jgi:uncharacterized protein YjbJ (UPF0337 family)
MAEIHNKARNATQGVKGKAKEAAGKATDNKRLRAKGKADQAKSKMKKTGQKVKETERGRDWKEILVASALQGALFGLVNAALARASAKGFERATGPGRADSDLLVRPEPDESLA